ncbi:MAG: glycoside hydrolase family 130 protein [Chloroflexia bacterium]
MSELTADTGAWGFGSFQKYSGNPIIEPTGEGWEAYSIYNPAAWTDGEKVYLLYRAEGPTEFPGRAFTSRIGLAVSEDGVHFTREARPVFEPTEDYEIPGGCEDPRLVRIGGVFYMTYTAFDGTTPRLAMAVSRDLHNWEKRGPLFPERGWTKSGAILAEPVDGYYWMYFGDSNLWTARSKDLEHWELIEEPALAPREGHFDSRLVEAGPPPIATSQGIVLIYDSADDNLRYSVGQALFQPSALGGCVRRSSTPILEPETVYENEGQVPQVVFAEGLVQFKGKWLLYFGMADSRIGLATSESLRE